MTVNADSCSGVRTTALQADAVRGGDSPRQSVSGVRVRPGGSDRHGAALLVDPSTGELLDHATGRPVAPDTQARGMRAASGAVANAWLVSKRISAREPHRPTVRVEVGFRDVRVHRELPRSHGRPRPGGGRHRG